MCGRLFRSKFSLSNLFHQMRENFDLMFFALLTLAPTSTLRAFDDSGAGAPWEPAFFGIRDSLVTGVVPALILIGLVVGAARFSTLDDVRGLLQSGKAVIGAIIVASAAAIFSFLGVGGFGI